MILFLGGRAAAFPVLPYSAVDHTLYVQEEEEIPTSCCHLYWGQECLEGRELQCVWGCRRKVRLSHRGGGYQEVTLPGPHHLPRLLYILYLSYLLS